MAENSNKLPSNPVARIRKRLSEIRKTKVSQASFAEEIGVSEKYLSMIETGARSMNYKLAQRILEKAPVGTRIEWIMGEDGFETEEDLLNYECTQAKQQSERLGVMEVELLKKIAAVAGYRLERKHLSIDDVLHGEEGYIFVDDDGNTFSLGFFGEYGVQALWYDFFDYAAFRLRRNIEKKYNSISWTVSSKSEEGDKNG